MSDVHIHLRRSGPSEFVATDTRGNATTLSGSPALAEEILARSADPDRIPREVAAPAKDAPGFRPMAMLLVSLAACAALDLVHILTKQKQPLGRLEIDVVGTRPDTVPSPYEKIRIAFVAYGEVDPARLERAAELSVRKYCSVGSSLKPEIVVEIESAVRAS